MNESVGQGCAVVLSRRQLRAGCVVSLLIMMALIPLNAWGKDYYVSKSGSDVAANIASPGPNAQACRTIQYVIDNASLSGGDIVWIQAGTYDESVKVTSADSGLAGQYVTFKSYQNDDVIITRSINDYPFQIYGASAWIQYIKVDGSGLDGGTHLRITTTMADRCLVVRYAEYIWITHCEIDHAVNNDCIKMQSNNAGTDSGGTDDNTGPKYCIVEYCKIHDGADYGIKLTGWGTNSNIIRYNEIYNNGGRGGNNYGLNVSGSGYAGNVPKLNEFYGNTIHGNYNHGLQFTYCSGNKVWGNRFYSNGQSGLSFGSYANGNEAYGNFVYNNGEYGILCYIASGNKIYNNVVYGNAQDGVMIEGVSTNNEVYNNTIHGAAAVALYMDAATTGTQVVNNIGIVTGGNPALHNGGGATAVLDHNDWFKVGGDTRPVYWDGVLYSVAQFAASKGQDVHSLSVDPAFVDALGGNYNLQKTSACIGAGTNLSALGIGNDAAGVSRPNGVGWTIGAFEASSVLGAVPPAAPSGLRIR